MITSKTPDQIAALGLTIATASEELERVFIELTKEADHQLAAAAEVFIIKHAHPTQGNALYADYAEALSELTAAAVAASNVLEMSRRATTLRSKCAWWKGLAENRRQLADARAVSDRAPIPGGRVPSPAREPHERHPGAQWIDDHYAELPVNEWVAASKDGIVAHSPVAELINQMVSQQGFQPSDVAVAFVDAPGPPLARQ